MRNYKKEYKEVLEIANTAVLNLARSINLSSQINDENKNLRAECSKVISELSDKFANCKKQHDDTLRLLDSYMQTNARQAQDIIELESVAIALYDVLWHMVHSVEDELKDKDVVNLNAYKTIVALFEAEGDD